MICKSVSVVIPFYNGNKYLKEALESIDKQTTSVKEIIVVVDNKSEMPIIEDVYSYEITVIHNPEDQNGAGLCRYYGYEKASSRFVTFLDPDDLWSPDKINHQVQFMIDNEMAFSFTAYENFESSDVINSICAIGPFSLDNFLKKKFTIGCLTVMIDKSLIQSVKKNYLKRRNDYMMWFEVLTLIEKQGYNWGGLNVSLAKHRIHSASLTDSKIKAAVAYWKYLGFLPVSSLKRISYFCSYTINTISERVL